MTARHEEARVRAVWRRLAPGDVHPEALGELAARTRGARVERVAFVHPDVALLTAGAHHCVLVRSEGRWRVVALQAGGTAKTLGALPPFGAL